VRLQYARHNISAAKAGETLICTAFRGNCTRGFANAEAKGVAVCLLPGTELVFEQNVRHRGRAADEETNTARHAPRDQHSVLVARKPSLRTGWLPDRHAAWEENHCACQILQGPDGRLQPSCDWRMEVTDEFASPLFAINVSAKGAR
jgi:hypothetical protein